jgi:hypothetical protein
VVASFAVASFAVASFAVANATNNPVLQTSTMDSAEYERRRAFIDTIKTMSRPEHMEIARILRKHGVTMSENRSGIFFDMAKLTTEVFEELLRFREFVLQNNQELDKRDVGLKAADMTTV